MKGNIVVASSVLAVGLVVASVVLVLGIKSVADKSLTRIEAATQTHAQSVERAGAAAGLPMSDALKLLTISVDKHSAAVTQAGNTIAQPNVQIKGPVEVGQPIRILGPAADGALPVNATIGK